MPRRDDRRVARTGSGRYEIRFDEQERQLLLTLRQQLVELLETDTSNKLLRRLFPPAYDDQPELEEEYRRLMGDDILRRKLDALEAVEATASETEVSEEQVTAWLSAIHDLRLVLGTSLDVQEDLDFGELDPTSPDAPTYALYEFLTVVEYQIVEALTASL